ncbi:MAG: cytochrome c biogenesis protein ResB [Lentisphaeraceae bacterium]|nr:cytochrome c biogenesis protein ResB [Lentisphaeraceae bacterium]
MSEPVTKSFSEKHSFSLSILITTFFLILPGFLEAVSVGLENFQKNNPFTTFLIWFNLWWVSQVFVFSKPLGEFYRKEKLPKRIIKSFASLKLTVFLLSVSLILVFVGTLAQTSAGIWEVVDTYFRCAFSRVDVSIFVPGEPGEKLARLHFFFPGGFIIGGCLLVNLLSAHSLKFRINAQGTRRVAGFIITALGLFLIYYIVKQGIEKEDIPSAYVDSYKRVLYRLLSGLGSTTVLLVGCWLLFKKRAGIVILHFGIILLLVAELVTAFYATEGTMTIAEGDSVSFVDVSREFELAISEPGLLGKSEKSITIPEFYFDKVGEWQTLDGVPMQFKVLKWFPNADVKGRSTNDESFSGLGKEYKLAAVKESNGVEEARVSLPGMIVEFKSLDGSKELGKYILSHRMYIEKNPAFSQDITIDGKVKKLMLRNKRDYLYSIGSTQPVEIKLIDFRHDTYLGTSVAKNFSSLINLEDKEKEIDRKVLISMNNPLRYTGRTFYQQSFAPDESGTVLQVVHNPGWMIPYLCCVIVGVGMLFQFLLTLIKFSRRQA